jgi:glycosyltransferase involved in cell wall biosynthesis
MRILHLIAGAGPMYCGSCLHGNTLAAGLRKAGADIVLAPLYTPIRTDEENLSIDRLSMGGINVYLDESLHWWRRMPTFLRRLMDRPRLVSWAATFGGGTRPEQLGRLAVAMFRGDDGPLKDDVEQLLNWLEVDVRPDIVHLSNVMLAALARPLKERLGAKVVATLTGEDGFLEKLPRPYYEQARAELRARSADLDAIIALSRDYGDFMAGYLGVPREKIEVMRPGLNLEGFPVGPSCREGPADLPAGGGVNPQSGVDSNSPFQQKGPTKSIGFLSRISPDKGLHLLIEALHAMQQLPNSPPLRLRAAGYLDRADRRYLRDLYKQAAAYGLADRFEYVGELDRAGKIAFLESLDVFCVPSLLRESKGLPVLEACACGVPVVAPDHGAFSELVADTGGGLLYDPGQPGAFESALRRLFADAELAAECGHRGRQAVHERYTSERETQDVLALYARLGQRQQSSS